MRQAPGAGPGSGLAQGIGSNSGWGAYGPTGTSSPTGSDYGDDPYYRSLWSEYNPDFVPASERFKPGHRYSSVNPKFLYGRRDWQETRNSPEYKQWEQRARQQQLFMGLLKMLGYNVPWQPHKQLAGGAPQVDTQWDDVLRGLRGPGPIAPYSGAYQDPPPQSDRPNYW